MVSSARVRMAYDLYQQLTESVNMVIHNGAVLNFILPYCQLKKVNVTGTAETLRFACTGKAKYFHYISSYSVDDTSTIVEEKIYAEIFQDLLTNYQTVNSGVTISIDSIRQSGKLHLEPSSAIDRASLMYGVEYQANVINQMLRQDFKTEVWDGI